MVQKQNKGMKECFGKTNRVFCPKITLAGTNKISQIWSRDMEISMTFS